MSTSHFIQPLRACLLIALLFCALPPDFTKAEDLKSKYGDWTTTLHDNMNIVINSTHGSAVHGHKFGFAKLLGSCDRDLFWISWSSGDEAVKKFSDINVFFKFEVGGDFQQISIKLLSTHTLIPRPI